MNPEQSPVGFLWSEAEEKFHCHVMALGGGDAELKIGGKEKCFK